MKRILIYLLATPLLFGEAGVLIPSTLQQPDPAVLSLSEMNIRIRIDNHHARVETRQIFANHTGGVLEGNYTFALPGRALAMAGALVAFASVRNKESRKYPIGPFAPSGLAISVMPFHPMYTRPMPYRTHGLSG